MDSPEYKEMKREEKKKQNELGRDLVKREKLVDELARIDTDLEELRARRTRLADRLDTLRKRLASAAPSALGRLQARSRELDAEYEDLNRRNDHVMLRNLPRAPGFLHRENGTVHVELWLKGHFEPGQLRVFERFLDKTSAQINARLPQANERIRIALRKPSPTV